MAEEKNPYGDIICLPHHRSLTHPRMSMTERAAQFAPYAALVGFDDMVRETARWTDEEAELSETELERLNEKLLILQEAAGNGLRPEVTVCCFVPDARKAGGSYREFSGTVKKVDEAARQLVFYGGNGVSDGQRIDIARIRELRSSEYSENEEGEREG